MSTITVPRADLTTEKVCKVLRDGLGASYDVVPGMAMAQTIIGTPHRDEDAILVGKGSYRLFKAEIRMQRRGGETVISISPGGLTIDLVVNSLGIARKAREVLANSPELALCRGERPVSRPGREISGRPGLSVARLGYAWTSGAYDAGTFLAPSVGWWSVQRQVHRFLASRPLTARVPR
jgi:hypothetical protein